MSYRIYYTLNRTLIQLFNLNTKIQPVKYIDKLIKNGVYSVNDGLEFLDENTIGPEGDLRMIQSNRMKLGQDPVDNDDKIEDDGKEDN